MVAMSRASESDDASGARRVASDGVASGPLVERMRGAFERALLEPLSVIASMAGIPARGTEDGPGQAIASAAAHADVALRDLLEFLEYQLGGVPVVRRRVDLRLLCERVLDSIQSRYPESPIAFSGAVPVDGDWDPDRLASLLSRLVVDAVERDPSRRVVRVLLRGVGNRAVLDVCTPPSRMPGALARPFEPFGPGSSPEGDGPPRLGLGLYLAHEIALAHGGSIEVLQDAAAGTTLRVTLPRH
jgi:signal transduction histidine kinase